ncbi:MAG: GMC oxidoreductase [Acidovorax sp.]
MQSNGQSPQTNSRRTSWVSHGFETLIQGLDARRTQRSGRPDFDVLVIGSGYGGAIAADRLAGTSDTQGPLSIAVLERGREHLTGSFPDRAADLAGHVRFTTPQGDKASGRLEGLFDIRIGTDVSVLVGNGVGGGSLINAGVMAFPEPAIFQESMWPVGLLNQGLTLAQRAEGLQAELGADPNAKDTVRHSLRRVGSMKALGAATVPITVALDENLQSVGGVKMNCCIACGDCATGCNHGSKISLDLGLLRRAQVRGVEIFSGATVTRLRRDTDKWEVEVWHTDVALRKRMAGPVVLSARRVVLAAGTLGSTELLMRSQESGLSFSPALGRRFSANGDLVATVASQQRVFHGVADEVVAPAARQVGPTITTMIDKRNAGGGFVVQDLAVPGALVRLLEEGVTTALLLHKLDEPDLDVHLAHDDPGAASAPDPLAVDPGQIERSQVVALIARDGADGVMTAAPQDHELPLDAGVRIDWRRLRNDERFDQAHKAFAEMLGASDRLIPNPVWKLLPPGAEKTLGAERGPLVSVHPLGGCCMADDRSHGVVDRDGRVFDGAAEAKLTAVHEGLVVLDGAIVPGSIGINPALTISTLADLAIERLIDVHWALTRPASPKVPLSVPRPVFAQRNGRPIPRRTEVQVIEKLSGPVDLDGEPAWMQLSLVYEPRALFPGPTPDDGSRPAFTQQGHVLQVAVDDTLSEVRLYRWKVGDYMSEDLESDPPMLRVPLAAGSTLRFLHRESSTWKLRRCRAWTAWLWNRGLRDSVLALIDVALDKIQGRKSATAFSVRDRFCQSLALATRAGEVRLFDYDLKLGAPLIPPFDPKFKDDAQRLQEATRRFAKLVGQHGLVLKGGKRFTYDRRANPWTQLTRMKLAAFGGLQLGARRSIDVSLDYFARRQIPLIRVVGQENQPAALIDVLAFTLYVLRVFVSVHLWSGRKPDQARTVRAAQRLPGALPGLPEPEIFEFVPDGSSAGEIRLTRYPVAKALHPPVLMIHGYSASGTTFAHPALRPSLAEYLWRHGREPWVLDMRTSCGMPTADHAYSFEEIARHDIPAALREVCARTGMPQVDVVSHCMGSVMLTMTLSDQGQPHAAATAARMRCWVMSQFGTKMRFAPANLLRAYLLSWFRHLLPDFHYSLRPGERVGRVDATLYDRLIATLPYLDDEDGSEFDIENPRLPWLRRPWVGTRRRLDALIGRTFDSRTMDEEVLACIDDFFGPLNLATISQPIYFAKYGEPAEQTGLSVFGEDPWHLLTGVRMLSLHGRTNGLADTGANAQMLMEWKRDKQLTKMSPPQVFERIGHQDLLIGRDRGKAFDVILSFLSSPT